MRDVRQKHGSENIMAVDNGLNAALKPFIAEASFNGEERLLNVCPPLYGGRNETAFPPAYDSEDKCS